MTTYEYTTPVAADVVVVNLDRDNDSRKLSADANYANLGAFLERLVDRINQMHADVASRRATFVRSSTKCCPTTPS